METAKSFTSNIPGKNGTSKSETDSSRSEARNYTITVTKYLSQRCSGFYTDSISEYFSIKCLDPKHNVDEVGHQPTSDADDALPKTTATQPTKLGSVIKWNIQQG
jgi:hypothetical protein